ncbi:hypothetical protein ACE3NQ_23880 [Paenibacillus terreus]|uniref:Uncharacterized protein n=2 Tax=Paenibacillus terreus TaxID=1387834 RepID=A0ABV5BE22_9BACL
MDYITFLTLIPILLYLILFGVGIYVLVLFIKLARRGIKALDLYIAEKSNRM